MSLASVRRPPTSSGRKLRQPPPAHDADGRARILDAAVASFSSAGYEGTSTAAVSRAAGVTQPLVHHHFGSKEGLWRCAIDHAFAGVGELTRPDPALPREVRLAQSIEGFVRLSAARPALARIIAREGSVDSPRLKLICDTYLREPFREMVTLLTEGQTSGVIAPDLSPELLLFFVLGAGGHLFDVAALAKRTVGVDVSKPGTTEKFIELVLAVLVRGVLVKEKP